MRRDGNMLGIRITRQGHVHVEGVQLLAGYAGHRVWYVQTEQKRPEALVAYALDDDHDVDLLVDAPEKLYLRDGEDGDTFTHLNLRLPRRWWRRTGWQVYTESEKWGLFVVAVRQRRLGHWQVGRRHWASGPSD